MLHYTTGLTHTFADTLYKYLTFRGVQKVFVLKETLK